MEFFVFVVIVIIIFLICALCKSGKRKPMFSGEFYLLLTAHEMHLVFANHLLIQWFIKFSFHTKIIQIIGACFFFNFLLWIYRLGGDAKGYIPCYIVFMENNIFVWYNSNLRAYIKLNPVENVFRILISTQYRINAKL